MRVKQYGTIFHTTRETIHPLKEKFENCIILGRGEVSSPPRSGKLIPSGFILFFFFFETKNMRNNPTVIL